eukprot:scaffold5030_cov24-Tisochrysis_lutea.AAC.1
MPGHEPVEQMVEGNKGRAAQLKQKSLLQHQRRRKAQRQGLQVDAKCDHISRSAHETSVWAHGDQHIGLHATLSSAIELYDAIGLFADAARKCPIDKH